MAVRIFALLLGGISMFVSLFYDSITMANEDYRIPLTISFVSLLISVASCAYVISKGGKLRWLAVIVLVPGLFVIFDLTRRVPAVFSGSSY